MGDRRVGAVHRDQGNRQGAIVRIAALDGEAHSIDGGIVRFRAIGRRAGFQLERIFRR